MPASPAERPRGTVLFVSYDGLCDHIARSQILPYVFGLAARGWAMTVVSHEKPDVAPRERDETATRLAAAGVGWLPQPYRRLGGAFTTMGYHWANDVGVGLRFARRGRLTCVHARSYIPAVVALTLKRLTGAPMLFDMRGFWFDEKVETGLWPPGLAYRSGKAVEPPLFGSADAVVSLTEAARGEIETWGSVRRTRVPVSVIPTCVDVDASQAAASVPPAPGPPLIGYVGSFGRRYLVDEMVAVFARVRARRPGSRLEVLTTAGLESLWVACARHGVDRAAVSVDSVPHEKVAERVARWSASLCFVLAGGAAKASCPTKFGESLAVGCPVVVNEGVGDCASIARSERVGVATAERPDDPDATAAELLALLDEGRPLRLRCVEVARRRFDLPRAIDEYDRIYARLDGLRHRRWARG